VNKALENTNKTYLCQVWGATAVIVGVNEVGLGPEGPKARLFELRPPLEERWEVEIPGVNFELQLTKR
jgi:hypothetical protein